MPLYSSLRITLILALQGHIVTLEIDSGEVYRGKLLEGRHITSHVLDVSMLIIP